MRTCSLLIVCATLGACSTPVIVSKPAHVGGSGIAYALPKAQAEVQVQRTLVEQGDIDKANKRVAELKAAKPVAEAAKKEADALLKSAKADAAQAATDEVKSSLGKVLKEAEARAKARAAEAKEISDLLAAAESWVEQLKANPNACVLTAGVKLLDPVPDRSHRYLAQHQAGQLRDDHYILKVSKGMLGSASSDSNGQLGSALQSLAGLAGLFVEFKSTLSKPVAKACEPGYVHHVFDPSLSNEEQAARELITGFDPALKLIVHIAGAAKDASKVAEGGQEAPGLLYRAPVDVVVGVAIKASPKPILVQAQGLVPDASTLAVLPVMGDMLTRRNTGYEFVNGMPVSMDETRPSKLVAALRIPIDMAKAFVEVPASILKLRVDLASQQNNLSEQEIVALKKQLALLEAEQALRDKQKPASGDSP